jgi:hypothetical protein
LYGPPTLLTGGSPAGGVYSGTSVSGGIFTPNAVGDFEITYTYTDANNCSNSATQILRVVICTGLETNEKQSVRIYPNPSTGTLFLEFGDQVNMLRGLRVLNTSGQVVYNRNLNLAYCDYGTAISLDMADLSDGVYFLELVSTDNIEVLKFLIQR